MSSLPIACSLSDSDLAAAKASYEAASSQYHASARISENHADVVLTGDKTAIHALLSEMVERERACCPFLTFEIEETAGGFAVRLGVISASGLETGIVQESVATFFPAATMTST